MTRGIRNLAALAIGAAALAACSGGDAELDPDIVCHVGIYQTAEGALIDLGALSAPALRWRAIDGRTGRISPAEDGSWSGFLGWSQSPHPARLELGACGSGEIFVQGIEGISGEASRLDFVVQGTRFDGEGETLAGRLVMPQGEGPFPLAVLVHGSEDYSAVDFYSLQRILPAHGIAAFVYDKRGTGGSTGGYTQDFDLLAADASAALTEARRLGGDRIAEAGYLGGSQGGWVAPYAASMSDADFVIASYGMAEGPLAEDREEALLSVIEAGYGDDAEAMAGTRALAVAAGRVMATDFDEGVDELADLKNRYRDEPWFDQIEGEFTHEFLVRPIWQVEAAMPFFDRGTSWDYEPRPVLASLDIPALWVLAAEDREAPPDTTIPILEDLQAEGTPVDVVIFPDADHGIIEFETLDDGSRTSTRYSEGYHRLLVEWIRSRQLQGAYGRARIMPRQGTEAAETE